MAELNLVEKVDAALKAVCPIDGVSIGRDSDKTTWRIDFSESATADQRAAAQGVIDSFDVTKTLQISAIDDQLEAIDDATRAAMRGLRDFILIVLAWATAAKQSTPTLPEIPQNDGILKLAALEQAATALRAQRKAITG